MTEQNKPQDGSNPRMWQGREIRNDMTMVEKTGRPKSFIEKETDAIMARVTKQITPATAHFKKIGEAAQQTTKVFKNLGEIGQAKKDYHTDPAAPLSHRPFYSKEMRDLRDQLRNNAL